MSGIGIWCESCGQELSEDIHDAVYDEKGDYLEKELGLPNEPVGDESSHVKIVYRDTGPIPRCTETNQFTSFLTDPPGEESQGDGNSENQNQSQANGGGGNGGGAQPQQSPSRQQQGPVYDFPEDKDPMDILMEVITNDVYDLSKAQAKEVHDWASIYDGQIPPDQLEELLSNMSGVQKQTARLMRQKYEAKLNKWIQQQGEGQGGPSLGATVSAQTSQMPNMNTNPKPNPTPNGNDGGDKPSPEEIKRRKQAQKKKQQQQEQKKGRDKRVERRQEVIDKAADEFARNFAQNAAEGAGTFFKDMREIARTLFKKKAEKDPDWFFEKAEKWDMELFDELMTESDQKRMTDEDGSGGPSADLEVDSALESVKSGGNNPQPRNEQTPSKPQPEQAEPEPDDELDGMINEMEPEGESVNVASDGGNEPEDEDEFDDELDDLLNEFN